MFSNFISRLQCSFCAILLHYFERWRAFVFTVILAPLYYFIIHALILTYVLSYLLTYVVFLFD